MAKDQERIKEESKRAKISSAKRPKTGFERSNGQNRMPLYRKRIPMQVSMFQRASQSKHLYWACSNMPVALFNAPCSPILMFSCILALFGLVVGFFCLQEAYK
jgi:hypothetical protein